MFISLVSLVRVLNRCVAAESSPAQLLCVFSYDLSCGTVGLIVCDLKRGEPMTEKLLSVVIWHKSVSRLYGESPSIILHPCMTS
jgi:hypothetical protein